MIISPFIKTDYFTVRAFQGINQVRKTIFEHGSALVISEDSKPIGIITAHDLATRQHNLVIDCLTDKPKVTNNHLIPEVLSMMQKVHSDALMVYEGGELTGIVHKRDLTDYLCRSIEQQKTLVHSIAHDLKNPLSSVLSATYLLEDVDAGAEHKELVSLAQQACNYANGIINDLLFSDGHKNEPLNKERLELNELITDCVESFKIALQQKDIRLSTPIQVGECYIAADRIKLKRAFSNLISNAIKFTPSGGGISVITNQQDSHLLIAIKDSGIGISVEMQPHIFDKFTNAKRQGTNGEGSTGLGMFITKQIIEQHGGKIWFESQEQQGTTFYIKL
ncbi:sensor histidine kinase [Mucilaginibacter paludis]|uniref:histidine kinase n=1 Tax=Mucilaginibacter paludis DSM 18603 TaxID=714943 RepID=H1YGC3_9SPHI|nr:HAMP domain-containing sensor histidine kinase [Mucilaginibacter paludis]EHQ24475.1 CBS sensor signal transduction histidine kinase [Mucilaginibacter paludis DSM 18603]